MSAAASTLGLEVLRNCIRCVFPRLQPDQIEIGRLVRGTINDIYAFRTPNGNYCLRIGTRANLSRYSDVLKEPVVARYFNNLSVRGFDRSLSAYEEAEMFASKAQTGGAEQFSGIAEVLYYDMSKKIVLFNWQCLRWADGEPLDYAN